MNSFLNYIEAAKLPEIKKNISNIDYRTKNKGLLIASDKGYLEIVKFLIQNGADINTDDGGALRFSSYYGHFPIVKYLIKNGANMRIEALTEASVKGYLEIVKFLVENTKDINYDLALRFASKSSHLDIVKFLVENGANVNAEDDYSLRIASKNGHTEVVKFLVENKANIHANNDESLREASFYGYYEIVKILVENGVDIHTKDDESLRWASGKGHFLIVQFLVDNGANVHANNDEALRLASRKGYFEIVKILIENGADVNANNDEFLIMASENGHFEIVKLLVFAGAIVNDDIILSISQHNTEIIDFLTLNKNKINIRIAPSSEWTEEIIQDPNFIYICNSENITTSNKLESSDEDKEYFQINGKNPIDSITLEPIPLNLLVFVKSIEDKEFKLITFFNAEFLYKYWLEQAKSEAGITYKYAANPLTRGYFNKESVDFVIEKLNKI